MLESRENAGF